MNRKGSIPEFLTPIINFEYSELFKMNTTNGLTNQNKQIIHSRSFQEHDFDHVEHNDPALKSVLREDIIEVQNPYEEDSPMAAKEMASQIDHVT